MKKAIVSAAVACALLAGAPAAAADPSTTLIEGTCRGTFLLATSNGNGPFVALHDLRFDDVLHVIALDDLHVAVYDAEGVLVEEHTEEAVVKGSSGKNTKPYGPFVGPATPGAKVVLSCGFTATLVGDGSDPKLPEGYVLVVTGGLTYW